MRALLLVLLILASTIPFSNAAVAEDGSVVCPAHVAVLPEDASMLEISETNSNADELIITSTAPSTLEIGNATSSVQNGVQVWSVPISANTGLAPGRYPLNVSLLAEGNVLASCTLDVWVRGASALVLGLEGPSVFTVQESTRTGIAVNLTNVGAYDENVTFSMTTTSHWDWGWTLNGVQVEDASTSVDVGELIYIGAWIDVAAVEDSRPLAGEGPMFTISVVSSFDGRGDAWSFVLAMEEVYRVNLTTASPEAKLDPGNDVRVPVVVTNIGNTPATVEVLVSLLDEDGEEDSRVEPSDRFVIEGWTVALFGTLPQVELAPGASRTFEVGFLAPWMNEGHLHVQVSSRIGSHYDTVDLTSEIEIVRSFAADFLTPRCNDLEVDAPCTLQAMLTNTGNYDDVAFVDLNLVEQAEGIVVLEEGTLSKELAPGKSATITVGHLTAHPEALAFMEAQLEWRIGPLGEEATATANLDLRIAPRVEWVVVDVKDERVGNTVSVSATLRNNGNLFDGLQVSMKSSHGVPMGLLPPENAVYEEGDMGIRMFEIDGIPIGSNISLRAWYELPNDEEANGTVFVNLSLQSKFVPDQIFVHQTNASYLGIRWQPATEPVGIEWRNITSGAMTFFAGAWHILLAVVIASAVVQRALKRRGDLQEQQAARQPLAPKEPERVEDWMAAFQRPPEARPLEPSRTVHPDAFRKAFENRSSPPTPAPTPVDPALAQAATAVLDATTSLQANQRLDSLASSLSKTEAPSEIDRLLDDLDLG